MLSSYFQWILSYVQLSVSRYIYCVGKERIRVFSFHLFCGDVCKQSCVFVYFVICYFVRALATFITVASANFKYLHEINWFDLIWFGYYFSLKGSLCKWTWSCYSVHFLHFKFTNDTTVTKVIIRNTSFNIHKNFETLGHIWYLVSFFLTTACRDTII